MAGSRRDGIGFRVLGPIELVRAGSSVTVGHAKQRSVLAVLLVEANQTVVTEELIDRVWGEAPPARVRNVLSGYVTRLRTVIEEAGGADGGVGLGRRSGGYQLVVPAEHVDLHRFRALVDQSGDADPERGYRLLDDALRLWRGPAFAATGGVWLDRMRDAVERERVAARLARAGAALRLGRAAGVVGDLTELAARYPLDEQVAAQLMRALNGSGRQSEALAVYPAMRARLADELGVDPGAPLRELHRELLRGEPVPEDHGTTPAAATAPASGARSPRRADPPGRTATTPRQLPPAAAQFTGRAAHLAALAEQLDSLSSNHPSTVTITAIHGSAGVGKTALAVYWAHQAASRFPDGQLYLNLRGFDHYQPPAQPTEALGALLRSLGVGPAQLPSTVDEQAALYRTVLADRRMLILLDNAASSGQVRPLLPGARGCMVLVTSRNELTGLVAGDGARPLGLDVLDRSEALTLLAGIAGDARLSAEPEAAQGLADACARLPLALRIVANHLQAQPDLTLAALLDEVADERRRLDALDTDEESTSVRAVFSLSYQALKPEAARTFRLLGLHPGTQIGETAAAALTAVPPARLGRLLADLCQGHLIDRVGPHRYQLHDLLHLYAAERAEAEESGEERRGTVRRLLDWYLATAVAADRYLAPGRYLGPLEDLPPVVPAPAFASHQEAVTWYETEGRNLVAAVRYAAAAGEHVLAWQLTRAQWGYFLLRMPWADWLTTHEIGLDSARRAGDRAAEAWMLYGIGSAHYYPRRFTEAEGYFRRAQSIWRELGDPNGQAAVSNGLGNILMETRQLDAAVEEFEHALAMHTGAGNRYGAAVTMTALGEAHALAGHHALALDYARQALAHHEESGNLRMQALTLGQSGNALRGLGRRDEAGADYRRAIRVAQECGDRQAEAWARHFLAEAHHEAGDVDEARRSWLRAVELFDGLGDPQADDIRARLAEPS